MMTETQSIPSRDHGFLYSLMLSFFILPRSNSFVTPFYPNWACEFVSLTDIKSFGYQLCLAYPLSLLLLGMILWIVMIGVIAIILVR
jgi:hypothetical protein